MQFQKTPFWSALWCTCQSFHAKCRYQAYTRDGPSADYIKLLKKSSLMCTREKWILALPCESAYFIGVWNDSIDGPLWTLFWSSSVFLSWLQRFVLFHKQSHSKQSIQVLWFTMLMKLMYGSKLGRLYRELSVVVDMTCPTTVWKVRFLFWTTNNA